MTRPAGAFLFVTANAGNAGWHSHGRSSGGRPDLVNADARGDQIRQAHVRHRFIRRRAPASAREPGVARTWTTPRRGARRVHRRPRAVRAIDRFERHHAFNTSPPAVDAEVLGALDRANGSLWSRGRGGLLLHVLLGGSLVSRVLRVKVRHGTTGRVARVRSISRDTIAVARN